MGVFLQNRLILGQQTYYLECDKCNARGPNSLTPESAHDFYSVEKRKTE